LCPDAGRNVAGAFVNESAAELAEAEKTLRMFAAMEK
jgi:hypothetical protein